MANRDEDVSADPLTFRVDRTPNEHYGSGVFLQAMNAAAVAFVKLMVIRGVPP